jgi:hypothetical protein
LLAKLGEIQLRRRASASRQTIISRTARLMPAPARRCDTPDRALLAPKQQ